MRIGLDFDNTIACYDDVFLSVGREQSLLSPDFSGCKTDIKTHLLQKSPDGYLWEKLQGLVYGQHIGKAMIFPGVVDFLSRCNQVPSVFPVIISHKTVFAHHDPDQTNLREAALGWMDKQGILNHPKRLIDPANIIFEETREAKVQRIARFACDIFIDDLMAVLLHPAIPQRCRKILFRGDAQSRLEQYHHWSEISDAIFGDDRIEYA